MNFQDINIVESYEKYVDNAFSKARSRAEGLRKGRGELFFKEKELLRLQIIKQTLESYLKKIAKSFPDLTALSEFYTELMKLTLDYDALKHSLQKIGWAIDRINDIYSYSSGKIKAIRSPDRNFAIEQRKSYYGRINSVMKDIKKELLFLESARRIMKNYPDIKDLPTLCIVGFPNVGKTTLLKKLTGANAEIGSYAFTTQGVNLGYIKAGDKVIQLLDVPGTLNRLDKMNNIEKIAYISMKLIGNKVVYIYDLTEPYPLKDQEKLYSEVKSIKGGADKVIIYLSKNDIIDHTKLKAFGKGIYSIEELKEAIINSI